MAGAGHDDIRLRSINIAKSGQAESRREQTLQPIYISFSARTRTGRVKGCKAAGQNTANEESKHVQ
jgi:hypothetical protein